jgi:hypothetical protein
MTQIDLSGIVQRKRRWRRDQRRRQELVNSACYWLAALVGTVAVLMWAVQKWGTP